MIKRKIKKNKSPETIYKELSESHDIFVSKTKELEQSLLKKIEFEFFIVYQYSDGFVIVKTDSAENAPLNKCVSIINKKGILSYSDYKDITI